MGGNLSVPKKELEDLIDSTHFKKDDLKRWYKKFMKSYPDGRLDKEQFNEIYGKIYRSNYSNHMAEHIFRSFDHDKDGWVSFKELMTTLSITTHGTTREKLEWSFNVYDLDGNGSITMDEVNHLVKCMQTASRQRKSNNDTNACATSFEITDEVALMFDSVDRDHSGYWSLEEFIEGMQSKPKLLEMLRPGPEVAKEQEQ